MGAFGWAQRRCWTPRNQLKLSLYYYLEAHFYILDLQYFSFSFWTSREKNTGSRLALAPERAPCPRKSLPVHSSNSSWGNEDWCDGTEHLACSSWLWMPCGELAQAPGGPWKRNLSKPHPFSHHRLPECGAFHIIISAFSISCRGSLLLH